MLTATSTPVFFLLKQKNTNANKQPTFRVAWQENLKEGACPVIVPAHRENLVKNKPRLKISAIEERRLTKCQHLNGLVFALHLVPER